MENQVRSYETGSDYELSVESNLAS
jgi:hypothetical protein